MKTLVAFFSATGKTRKIAEMIAKTTKSDVFEIKPEVPYSAEDLDWKNDQSRSSVEMQDQSSRPSMQGQVPDLKNYDRIYVGFPIWWYQAPKIVNTFFEKADWKGKQIALFATSGSSGIDGVWEKLKSSAPGSVLVAAKRFADTAFQDEIDTWIRTM
ncbi:flavodoxin [Pseudoramibacter sp.]|jgi:flavodoxin|uniref:flavodoxin n=1 Tax=Pseudoramibacter sp. TaxID=2034862 RepID=UPI0025E3239B|nr:flavodoxin [Pseudoramibacter sp.]MCH4072962.1 flavodoxin [Pseudoramibacter sp.]MCH4106733.1 flavodoxin [Pseudoramibacter sp.]